MEVYLPFELEQVVYSVDMPRLRQKKIPGLLYLENALITGFYSPGSYLPEICLEKVRSLQ